MSMFTVDTFTAVNIHIKLLFMTRVVIIAIKNFSNVSDPTGHVIISESVSLIKSIKNLI